jgi:hypothetical protein
MTTDTTIRIPARLHSLAATAMLLERLDRMPRSASAGQYRSLVQQLETLLDAAQQDPADATLQALIEGLPSLAELHENRNYAHAGLCRSPLVPAIEAERATRELLARLGTPA